MLLDMAIDRFPEMYFPDEKRTKKRIFTTSNLESTSEIRLNDSAPIPIMNGKYSFTNIWGNRYLRMKSSLSLAETYEIESVRLRTLKKNP